MGVFSRFTDIINANLNALLDKAENPEKMVNLIIGEMEQTLVEVRSTAAQAIADKKELIRKNSQLKKQIAGWDERAEIAMSRNREDLARAAIVEKNKLEDVHAAQNQELVEVESAMARLEQDTRSLQAKLAEAKARREGILLRRTSARKSLEVRKSVDIGKFDKAFNKFELFEKRMEQLEAQVESYDLGAGTALTDQIESLVADEKIERELTELKNKVRKVA